MTDFLFCLYYTINVTGQQALSYKIGSVDMSKFKEVNDKITASVTSGYKKIENTVTESYQKIEDKFVDKYLKKDNETLDDAKKRVKKEQQNLEEKHKKDEAERNV